MSITIPAKLLPADGRFGSGPSKVRLPQIEAVMRAAATPMGTSHRQTPVKNIVGAIRAGLQELFSLPDGYEVVLGNGGATAFWAIATACLVEQRAQAAVFGEFGGKFATELARAPFLAAPEVIEAPPGSVSFLRPMPDPSVEEPQGGASKPRNGVPIDAYATVQNETSTGASVPISRPSVEEPQSGVSKPHVDSNDISEVPPSRPLMLVDGTSAAGALPIDIEQADVYYFSPQKVFASDGGLWIAIASPAAIERAARIEKDLPSYMPSVEEPSGVSKPRTAKSARWIPEFLSFTTALENSRLDQTLNTPAIATLIMFKEQVDWLLANGGLPWAINRSASSAKTLYDWAEASDYATPFVTTPEYRSNVVGTIDLADSIDAAEVVKQLRNNGIYDVFPYRKLGRNQLRVAMFPAIDPTDIAQLTHSIDFVVNSLT